MPTHLQNFKKFQVVKNTIQHAELRFNSRHPLAGMMMKINVFVFFLQFSQEMVHSELI